MTQTTHRIDKRSLTTVSDELRWAAGVDAAHISVSLNDGVITLSGEVGSLRERQAAVAAALRVAHVTAIADRLVVTSPPGCSDVEIAAQVGRVVNAGTTVPHNVRASVRDHQVTLTGDVASSRQRDDVAQLVAAVPGVAFVQNDIRVDPTMR